MRVTNAMLVDHVTQNLNRNLRQLDLINQKLSSGKEIRVPSDDPAKAGRSLYLRTSIEETEQYIRNMDMVLSWLQVTDSALDQTGKALQRARELAVYGASDTLPQQSRDALRQEVEQLLSDVIDVGNTTHQGQYIFAGQKSTTRPFGPDGSYNGNDQPLKVEIGNGIDAEWSLPGNQVFPQVFTAIRRLAENLGSGDADAISGSIQEMDECMDLLLEKRATTGARYNRLDLTRRRLEDFSLNLQELLSKNEDIDVARAITELKMQENVYRLALASGARMIQPTLLDYLR